MIFEAAVHPAPLLRSSRDCISEVFGRPGLTKAASTSENQASGVSRNCEQLKRSNASPYGWKCVGAPHYKKADDQKSALAEPFMIRAKL